MCPGTDPMESRSFPMLPLFDIPCCPQSSQPYLFQNINLCNQISFFGLLLPSLQSSQCMCGIESVNTHLLPWVPTSVVSHLYLSFACMLLLVMLFGAGDYTPSQ